MVETHSASLGILTKKRKMSLDVHPEVLPILDAVVLSFILVEEEKRETAEAAAGA